MFFDGYNNNLKNFLNSIYDLNKSNSENWENFYSSIDMWKTKYLLDFDDFTLYGVSGWYWGLRYCKFNFCDEPDYISIISLICSKAEVHSKEIDFYKTPFFVNNNFLSLTERDLVAYSLTNLTKDIFFDELSNQYQESLENFEYYVKNREIVSANPLVIEKLTPEYPRFKEFFDGFRSNLQECSVLRINDLGEDVNVWYFIKEDEYIHIMLVQDCM